MAWSPLACHLAEKGETVEFSAECLCELWLFVAGEETLGKLKSFSVVPYDMELRRKSLRWKRVEVLEEMEEGSALSSQAGEVPGPIVAFFSSISDYRA